MTAAAGARKKPLRTELAAGAASGDNAGAYVVGMVMAQFRLTMSSPFAQWLSGSLNQSVM